MLRYLMLLYLVLRYLFFHYLIFVLFDLYFLMLHYLLFHYLMFHYVNVPLLDVVLKVNQSSYSHQNETTPLRGKFHLMLNSIVSSNQLLEFADTAVRTHSLFIVSSLF